MAEPISTMEEVCEQATLRNMVMREATRQASESLQSALRTVVGSDQVPEEFLPKIEAPAPDIEALLALFAPEQSGDENVAAAVPAVPATPLPPRVQAAPTALAKSPVPQLQPAEAPKPATVTAKEPAPATAPMAASQTKTASDITAPNEPLATDKKITFQPMSWPSFGSSQPAPSAKASEKPAPPIPALGPNEVYFAPDEILFHKGDPADRFYMIRQGEVGLFEPSTQKQIATLSMGTSFGEQAILVGGVRSVSARAIGGVVCLAISAQTLRDMLEVEQGSIKPVFESLLLQLYLHNDLHARGHKYNA
ncbi:MAG: cyclic nucleotide-binding domain-containing protein [Betaproteobacteria bacterium]|nr:cyclic nucleotide-binding domain-containing protein [Betaproteobacteria bacterium]